MAFAAKLGTLAEELVEAICQVNSESDQALFESLSEAALRGIRRQNYLRTNQFLVEEQLDGLEEKFLINGRDGLACALKQRREALATCSSKWTPEILHLLLELSDRPLQQSHLGDLEALRAPRVEEGPRLQWEDVAAEDGWVQDRALWTNVVFHDDSSDDGSYEDADSGAPSSESGDTSVSGDSHRLDRIIREPHAALETSISLEDVAEAQSWRLKRPAQDSSWRSRKVVITEAQLVREVLFMLQGHSTTLFDDKCSPVLAYQLSGVSWETYRALVTSVAETGRPLMPLRALADSQQDTPLLQTFQDSIRRALHSFDKIVSGMQARYVDLKADMVVSVLQVMDELQPHMLQLRSLSAIVQELREERYPHAFRCLELLFERACVAQLEGDELTYKFLGPTFCDCFQIYLRPIRLWMEEGRLIPGDKIFFVSQAKIKVPLNQIWQGQFKLRKTQNGVLHAPKFLQPAASRIFTTGKSIVILKHLGRYDSVRHRRHRDSQEPGLDFAQICPPGFELAPFAELFGSAFDAWIKSKHHSASASLQGILFESCGLWSTVDALHNVYLMADGAAADSFASAVFNRMDRGHPDWNDRFALTELAQDKFSSLLDAHRVSAAFEPARSPSSTAASTSWIRDSLPRLRMQYRKAWPVQLVLSGDCMEKYQRVFTFLLQVRRAIYVLKGHRLLRDMTASAASSRGEQDLYHRLRARFLWFCNALLTYLTTLVFSPRIAVMRQELRAAEDVDAMIASHAAFVAALVQESCLGPRLEPIRDCILDVLDLAVRLEDLRRQDALREAAEMEEIARLSSVTSSPSAAARLSSLPLRKSKLRAVYVGPDEDEEHDDGGEAGRRRPKRPRSYDPAGEAYMATLRHISADFDRHVRFITGGLRGVSRASSDPAAGKWDMLAEMLETGIK